MFNRFKEDTTQLKDIESLLKTKVSGNVIKHEVRPLTTFGENFGSEILRVEITVEENGQQKILHAVAKLIPPTELQLEIFNTQVTFKNEAAFLNDIAPLLQDFQREYRFQEIADYFPELYGARFTLKPHSDIVDEDAVILMENLTLAGYGNLDRLQGFDLDGAKKVIKILANMQATAVAIKLKKPDIFEAKIRPNLREFKMPVLGDDRKDPMVMQIEPYLKEHAGTAGAIPKILKFLAKMRTRKSKKFREPWATIVHNDLWVNNIMVKQANDQVSEVKLVDFQVIEYGSPINDLIFFLLTSVQASVLRYHFDKLLLFHYNEFVKTIKQFNVDLKEFSYESFQEEIKLTIQPELYHALIMLNVVFGPKGMPKMPGKVAEWNPNRAANALSNGNSSLSNHAGPPKAGGPKSHLGPDGPPGSHSGPPSGPTAGHGGPSAGHGGPSSGHGGPPSGPDGPPVGHGGPSVGHGGPPGSHGGPPSGPGGPPSGHGGPPSGHGGLPGSHGGPSSGPGGKSGPPSTDGPPSSPWPPECKEKLWFMMEEAVKRNWI